MRLPTDLLYQISELERGRVVLVVGAGCSVEQPTNLPLSSALALDAHRRLVQDGVLAHGDCPEPDNLSCVADIVFSKTGSQQELVSRFPCERFRQAEPNKGHLLAAAMLYEQALGCVMTLNFDLALSNALAQIGTQGRVTVISKPEDYSSFSLSSLVYLHRNVEANPDLWVLRSDALEKSWRDGWEKLVTERVVGAPITVFVGLGSPIGVLEESIVRIESKLRGRGVVKFYQVDPDAKSNSSLSKKLGFPDNAYLQMSWCEFIDSLANRLVQEHRDELKKACYDLTKEESLHDEDVETLCQRITQHGLLNLGKIRARWMLASVSYIPRREVVREWLADLLLAIGLMERESGSQAIFRSDGIIEFRHGNSIVGAVIVAHGQGFLRWTTIETKVKQSVQYSEYDYPGTIRAIISGVIGVRSPNITPPDNIVCQVDDGSLIPPERRLKMYSVDDLRQQPHLVQEILS